AKAFGMPEIVNCRASPRGSFVPRTPPTITETPPAPELPNGNYSEIVALILMNTGDIVFKGVDGSECERFIRAVKIQAREQNKLRDERWILDLVEVSFEGNALRWFTKLDPAVRSNWDLLQEALLDRFPASDLGEAK
ncbi:hypothetical protein FRB99_002071, partial [Tulasnella sp. 403]